MGFFLLTPATPPNPWKSQGSSVAAQAEASLARGAAARCEGEHQSELKSR